jgi:hypothetical protein
MYGSVATTIGLLGALLYGPEEGDADKQGRIEQVILHGMPEPKTTPSGKLQRWHRSQVTVTIDDSINEIGPGAREAVMTSFGAWLATNEKLPALVFDSARGIKLTRELDGINSVIYAPIDIEGHENDLAVTIGYWNSQSGEIVEVDIVVNSNHPFAVLQMASVEQPLSEASPENADEESFREQDISLSSGDGEPGVAKSVQASEPASQQPSGSCTPTFQAPECGARYDLENVMAHEVGHFFGLGEDRIDRFATMFECTSRCETHKREPSVPDKTALSGVYAQPFETPQLAQMGCGVSGGRVGVCGYWSALLLLAAVGVARGRRNR